MYACTSIARLEIEPGYPVLIDSNAVTMQSIYGSSYGQVRGYIEEGAAPSVDLGSRRSRRRPNTGLSTAKRPLYLRRGRGDKLWMAWG